MHRIVESCLAIAVVLVLCALSYQAGRKSRDQWWRGELAAKSAAVRATMSRITVEAEGYDARLLQTIEADRAKLSEHEDTIRRLQEQITRSPLPPPTDGCPAVPARCLQRAGR